jgi:PIN domain nuclease of toxin-antitoxin system
MAAKPAILLDTSTLLWSAFEPSRLSPTAKKLLLDSQVERKVSLVSAWEIQIKHSSGKMQLPDQADRIIRTCAAAILADILTPTLEDVAALYRLPHIHRDPVDRMLAAQSIVSNLSLLSPDQTLLQYPIKVVW